MTFEFKTLTFKIKILTFEVKILTFEIKNYLNLSKGAQNINNTDKIIPRTTASA